MRSLAHRIWLQLGRRGVCLLMFAFLDFAFAVSYFFPVPEISRSSSVVFISHIAPLWAWGALWLGVGIVLLVNAFMINDRIGYAFAVGIKVLWALQYTVAIFYGVQRAWLSAALWAAIAGWVAVISTWPEPAPVHRE